MDTRGRAYICQDFRFLLGTQGGKHKGLLSLCCKPEVTPATPSSLETLVLTHGECL